jgi:segregation and condensation protein A
MRAYAEQGGRGNVAPLKLAPPKAFTMEEALRRLEAMLGRVPDWASLESFLPARLESAFERRSALASTVAATLELARVGRLQLRQGKPFGPIFLKTSQPS